MQRVDVRKNEQTSRLNLHVWVCEEEHQHVQIEPFYPFHLSNVDPLYKIILCQNIWWSLYKQNLYYWCTIFNLLILVRSNEISKWIFCLFFIPWSIYRDNLRILYTIISTCTMVILWSIDTCYSPYNTL